MTRKNTLWKELFNRAIISKFSITNLHCITHRDGFGPDFEARAQCGLEGCGLGPVRASKFGLRARAFLRAQHIIYIKFSTSTVYKKAIFFLKNF